jgi:hypothetical protein
MTKPEAEKLLQMMSVPGWGTFINMIAGNIDTIHTEMEWESTNIDKARGRIEELRKIFTLQDKAMKTLDKK